MNRTYVSTLIDTTNTCYESVSKDFDQAIKMLFEQVKTHGKYKAAYIIQPGNPGKYVMSLRIIL